MQRSFRIHSWFAQALMMLAFLPWAMPLAAQDTPIGSTGTEVATEHTPAATREYQRLAEGCAESCSQPDQRSGSE
jgi:hypothetical protein